jgi:hypothetical protein
MSLNPGFNARLTPLSAQTAVASVNQSKVLSFAAEFRNLFHAGGIHHANVFLSFCFFFLLTLLSAVTKLPEVNHRLIYFKVCWKLSKLAVELGKRLTHK